MLFSPSRLHPFNLNGAPPAPRPPARLSSTHHCPCHGQHVRMGAELKLQTCCADLARYSNTWRPTIGALPPGCAHGLSLLLLLLLLLIPLSKFSAPPPRNCITHCTAGLNLLPLIINILLPPGLDDYH